MFKTPLYNALVAHNFCNRASFHTPGHKGNFEILSKCLYNLDLTELPDTDSLFEASGVIKEAEKLAAKTFNTKRTLFSAGGCSLCIQTMLHLATTIGSKVICNRNIHRSVINAMALLGVEPIFVYPSDCSNVTIDKKISPEDIERSLTRNHNVSAVFVTSPNYYGMILDIKGIAKVCKKYNVPLLVDNAHGAHLQYVSGNLHPLVNGADLVADSAHKTLPVLTGGAFLHINNERYINKAKSAMSLFASTSPSYPIMASLDLCRDWLDNQGKGEFSALEEKVSYIKTLAIQKGFKLPSGLVDPIRLTLETTNLGFTGEEAAAYFRNNNIEPEYSDSCYVVFIATPFNSQQDLLKLENAIKNIPVKNPIVPPKMSFPKQSSRAVSLREAVLSESEYTPIESAINKIAAETICLCPPGIPLTIPGEIIDEKVLKILRTSGFSHINVLKSK